MCDRFYGEAADPPVWARCDYCGGPIYAGNAYWRHSDLMICTECAQRCAWAIFEKDAQRRTAQKESVGKGG